MESTSQVIPPRKWIPSSLPEWEEIHLSCGNRDLKSILRRCQMDFNSRINGSAVYYYDPRPAGTCVRDDAWLVKVEECIKPSM
jgi:hypothetical protein